MNIRSLLGGLASAGLTLALLAHPAPAAAQTGGVSGKILDAADKGVPDAEVTLFDPDGSMSSVKLKTNSKGEYQGIGIRIGDYQLKAAKGDLSVVSPKFHVGLGGIKELPELHLIKAAVGGGAGGAPMTEDAAKKQAALNMAFKAAQAALDAGNIDDGVAQFTKLAGEVPKCMVCYLEIGRALQKKGDLPGAEAAFNQAAAADPTKPDAYNELAAFYNSQKKFDEANKASAKANELMTASGSTDPVAIFNQGIILWNQGKAVEAQAQFQKVTQLDPKNADAQYYLGMTLVNQGKMADAKKPFDTYLSLAPTGQFADQVKGLLPLLK